METQKWTYAKMDGVPLHLQIITPQTRNQQNKKEQYRSAGDCYKGYCPLQ